jgi:hypothetical protein
MRCVPQVQTLLTQMVRGRLPTCRGSLPFVQRKQSAEPRPYAGLLHAQHTRFDMMSTTILSRIDDLGSQLDELERAVGDLSVAVRACTQLALSLQPLSASAACRPSRTRATPQGSSTGSGGERPGNPRMRPACTGFAHWTGALRLTRGPARTHTHRRFALCRRFALYEHRI